MIRFKKGKMGFLKSRFVCIAKFDDKVNMRFPNEIPPIHGPVILSFWTAYAMINDGQISRT